MGIEEKRERLMRYCENFEDECEGCLLDNHDEIEHCYYRATDNEIERNYNIVFGVKEETNNPDTYASDESECIDMMIDTFREETVKHFCIFNAFKYIWRFGKKNSVEDAKKAILYLNKYIELGNKGE